MTIFDVLPRPVIDALALVGIVAIVGASLALRAVQEMRRDWNVR